MSHPQTLDRILYVDDDAMLQALVRIALERRGGFTVEACREATAAVAAARAFRPDLVLLDVNMPDADGPSVLAALRADPAAAGLPVVFVTAGVGPGDAERYRSLGAADVIAKPFDAATLAARVRAVWDAWRARSG